MAPSSAPSGQSAHEPLGFGSPDDMLAQGPQALHETVASKMEAALGVPLPQMEVRFENLTLGADMVAADEADTKAELPSITNHVKKRYGGCCAQKTLVRRQILQSLSGVLKPGSMTLVLGQPGSGKSALLQLLSGRFPLAKNVVVEGDVTYNGVSRTELLPQLPRLVSYVPQTDAHFPMLSVRETLEFAHRLSGGGLSKRDEQHLCNGSEDENAAALEAARALYTQQPDIVLRQLGLQHCQDTVVGDNMLRGISGGERKRVTTGEMAFGRPFACMLDEISTGLDSAATFDIISTLRSQAQQFRQTTVISLLQPAPEVFELFDSVLLLHEGQVLYHGRRADVLEYFHGLGFVCPPHRDVADFLVDLSTDEQLQYQVDVAPRASVTAQTHPRLPSEFAELFRRSSVHAAMLDELHAPLAPALVQDAETHLTAVSAFQQAFWASTATLMRRQLLVTVRNKAFLRGKAVLLILMGLLYSSVFYQFEFEEVQVVMGIIFFSVMYLALAQTPMLPVYFSAREVFYKQRRANLYRTAAYVLSVSVSQIPLTLVESVVFGSFVYWMCGFVQTVGAYVLFLVLLFLTNLAFSAYFFYLSCATTDVHVAKPLAMTSLLMTILFAGFVVTRDQLPDYFIWLYWLDPIAWGIRSLAISQYRHEEFDQCLVNNVDYCAKYGMNMGEYYLSFFDIQTERAWIVYGVLFNVLVYLLFMFLAYYALEFKRIETPENLVAPRKEPLDDYTELATPKGGPKATAGRDAAVDGAEAKLTVAYREKNFVPVTVAFQDLYYTVPDPKDKKASLELLKGVSGFALPGKMTALMGASGAGKTTLMDVIAGRKTGGKAQGRILLNGFAASDLAIRRCTGYCEQMDVHADSATIREALTFSAFLRQGSDVSAEKKYDSVNECLELLDLDAIADRCVRGCSVEQLKRLTIGVELAAQPSVLFLDEPTSGLDARAAKVIMDGVRKVANTGRTILCTIHQPSAEVFKLFDSLLLLKRGGETVYFGDVGLGSQDLIDYFEAVPGVPAIEEGYNPATWMLEVIGAGVDSGKAVDVVDTDFVAHFQASTLKTQMAADLDKEGVSVPVPGKTELAFASKRAASNWTQAVMVTQRFFRMYWRVPTYNWTRMVAYVFMGFLFGLVFVGADYKTYQEVNSGLGMIFCTTSFLGILSLNSAVPVVSEARAAFYRERASQTYNSFWYFVGFTVVEIPYVVVSCFLFTVICLPLCGFLAVEDLAFYWLNLSLHVLCQIYLGQLLSFAMPSVEVAALLGVLFNSIFVLFMGFNPPASSIPHGYRWLFDLTPQRYSLMLFSALLFGNCPDEDLAKVLESLATANSTLDVSQFPNGCQILENAPQAVGTVPVASYLDAVFEVRHDDIHYYMFINIMMILALRFLALLSLRFINHQKK